VSEFEAIALTYSFVLGLGIAQILGAAGAALRNRHQRQLHWLPIGFAVSIFLFHIQYWFVLIDFDANLIHDWTWATYGFFLGLAVILFLSGGIVLPTPGADAGLALIDDFEVKGKLSLLFVAAYLMLWLPLNAWGNGGWLNVAVFINPAMTVPLLVAYYARPGRLRDVAATLFFVAQAFALLFVYSSPTDVS
jgi:hypothetical protein